jgi:hypothetical protein
VDWTTTTGWPTIRASETRYGNTVAGGLEHALAVMRRRNTGAARGVRPRHENPRKERLAMLTKLGWSRDDTLGAVALVVAPCFVYRSHQGGRS